MTELRACHAGCVHRLIRRLLDRKPTFSEQYMRLGQSMATAFTEGLCNPRPLSAEELANLDAYCAGVAHRSFPALYIDET